MHPLSIYLIEAEKHPVGAIIVAIILIAIVVACVFAIKSYEKKHPDDGDFKVTYDYSKPKVKVTYGEPKINATGCGHEGCQCSTPCKDCKCHPKSDKKDSRCGMHRIF